MITEPDESLSLPALQRIRGMCSCHFAARSIETLHPASFAMVMATGIAGIASHIHGLHSAAVALVVANLIAYVTIWVMFGARLVLYRDRFLQDLTDHQRGAGFFTAVAGTCVLGNQLAAAGAGALLSRALFWVSLLLWCALMYVIFTALTVKTDKPTLSDGINGGWLVAVVATQAVSGLGSEVLPHAHPDTQWPYFFSLVFWLFGGMLYIWMISLIFYRYTFFLLRPSDLMPPYWINMGAMAISTLAGTRLITNAETSTLLAELAPFLKGFTVFFWATATWWIPMLVVLGVWRHVYMRFPLRYDALYWGAVFPLGMYSVCTFELAKVLRLPFLLAPSRIFCYIALMAWALTFAGLIGLILGAHRRCDPVTVNGGAT